MTDLSGKKFDKLTVVGHVAGTKGMLGVQWECRCDCSPYAKLRAWTRQLVRGQKRDCGCRLKTLKRVRRHRAKKRTLCQPLPVTSGAE